MVTENHKKRLQKLLHQARNSLPEANPAWPGKIQRVVRFIHNHLYDNELSVGWMKEQCRVNGNNFSGKFKHYTGRTPKQYILVCRIEAAKILLKKTAFPILTIAIETGFSGQASFTNAFKNMMGTTPGKWRSENHIK